MRRTALTVLVFAFLATLAGFTNVGSDFQKIDLATVGFDVAGELPPLDDRACNQASPWACNACEALIGNSSVTCTSIVNLDSCVVVNDSSCNQIRTFCGITVICSSPGCLVGCTFGENCNRVGC